MLLTDGGTAVPVAPQTALVDEGSGKSAHRALKGAACARLIQRLLVQPLCHQFVHFGADGFRLARSQGKLCREDTAAVFFKNAVAVAQVKFCCRRLFYFALGGKVLHRGQHILHLAAVGTGVHVDRAAHRAGDAISKFQSGQAVFQRRFAQRREPHARPGGELCSVHLHSVLHGGNSQHRTIVALVGKQDITAIAQQIIPDALRLAQGNGAAKLRPIYRLHEQPCRAADFKGTMHRQRLIFFISNVCCGQQLLELFHRVRLLFIERFSPFCHPVPAGSAAPWLRCSPSSSGGY